MNLNWSTPEQRERLRRSLAKALRLELERGIKEKDPRTCGALTSTGNRCLARKVKGKKRCRFHGGLSTGPTTEQGKKKVFANLSRSDGRRGRTCSVKPAPGSNAAARGASAVEFARRVVANSSAAQAYRHTAEIAARNAAERLCTYGRVRPAQDPDSDTPADQRDR